MKINIVLGSFVWTQPAYEPSTSGLKTKNSNAFCLNFFALWNMLGLRKQRTVYIIVLGKTNIGLLVIIDYEQYNFLF
jgi:hypothetical protein